MKVFRFRRKHLVYGCKKMPASRIGIEMLKSPTKALRADTVIFYDDNDGTEHIIKGKG